MASWLLESAPYPKEIEGLRQEIDLTKRDSHIMTPHRAISRGFNHSIGLIEISLKRKYSGKGYISLKQLPNLPRGIINTINEKYIILLGYKSLRDKKDIWIVDLDNRKSYKSFIKLPQSICRNFYDACTMKNEIKTKLLTFGYINEIWKLPQFQDIQSLPFYLITLIQKWVPSLEYVHLIGKNKDMHQEHWTISVNEILKCDTECNSSNL